MSFVVSKRQQAVMFNSATKKNEFSEKLKDENMLMQTLTISRFLEGIPHKEFYKVQDVKKKTKSR